MGRGMHLKIESIAWGGGHSCNLNAWELESERLLQIEGIVGYVMSSKLLGLQGDSVLQKGKVSGLEGGLSS